MTNGFFNVSTIKEEPMISFRRLPVLLGAVLMLASAAFAQTGTITVQAQNPEAFSLTDTSGNTLSATISFVPVAAPANSTTVASDTATVRMRSNKAYKVSAQAGTLNTTGLGSADGGDTISLSDFGFGIMSVVNNGANVANNPGRADAVVSGFSVSSWPAATNGLTPSFGKKLSDITAATQVLSGPRISTKGNLATNNNFVEVTFGVATLPQYFTPNTGFSTVITLTMASQ